MLAQRYDHIQELVVPHSRTRTRVYKAFEKQQQRWVFIKMMIGHADDARRDHKLRQMFEREIDIAFELKHTNILEAIDYDYEPQMNGEAPLPFLVYPYMDDGSLNDLFSSVTPWEDWSLLQIADLILQAADALYYMHTRSQPLVHWDVKTDNFLIRREGRPARIAQLFLCDFGISRMQKGYFDQTSTPMGTPSHMPPEQWNGYVTCQSDQYALAVVACRLLTKEYPLFANNPNDLSQWLDVHKRDQPMPPSQLNPQRIQPGEIDTIILKALSKKPEQRFSDIWIFANELHNAIKKQYAATHADTIYADIPTLPVTIPVEPKFDPVPLHPPIDTAAYQIIDVPPPMIQQPVAPVKDIWSSFPSISYPLLLEHQLPAPLHTICWSPKGNYLACLFLTHPPLILDRRGGERLVPTVKAGHVACWAPNGSVLAISSQYILQGEERSKIEVVDLQAPASRPMTLTFHVPVVDGLDWSIHGQLAVWAWGESQIQVYTMSKTSLSAQSIPTPKFIPTHHMTCGGIGVLRWSPNGSLLAAGGKNGSLMCWRADTHTLQWQNTDSQRQVYSLAWSPDSTLLAVAFKDKRVVLWDVYKNRIQAEWKNLPMVPNMVSISQEQLLAVSSNKYYLLVGGIDQSVPAAKHRGYSLVAWSPTRAELATVDPEHDTKLVIWQK